MSLNTHSPTMYDRLDTYRMFMDWSIAQFAVELGIEYSTVYRALRGDNTPHDYNGFKFNAYYRENQDAIDEVYDAITAGL